MREKLGDGTPSWRRFFRARNLNLWKGGPLDHRSRYWVFTMSNPTSGQQHPLSASTSHDIPLFNSLEINPLQELGPVIPTKTFHPTKFSNKSTRRKASSTLYTLFFDVFWIPSFSWCSSCLHALKLPSAILGAVDVVNPCSTQRSSTGIIPGHRRENFQQFLSTWTMAGMTVEWQLAAKDVFWNPKAPHISAQFSQDSASVSYISCIYIRRILLHFRLAENIRKNQYSAHAIPDKGFTGAKWSPCLTLFEALFC